MMRIITLSLKKQMVEHMKKIYAVAVAALAISAAPAFAQSGPTAPAGARIEALAGYDHARVDVGNDEHATQDGFVYGARVGYDIPMGQTVSFGVDAEITDSTAKTKYDAGAGRIGAGRDLYAGGRITGALSDSFNLYGTVGYTNGRITDVYEYSNGDVEREHASLDGVRLGVGGQFTISPNAYALTEYRYSNYEAGFDRHQVLAGVGFRF